MNLECSPNSSVLYFILASTSNFENSVDSFLLELAHQRFDSLMPENLYFPSKGSVHGEIDPGFVSSMDGKH